MLDVPAYRTLAERYDRISANEALRMTTVRDSQISEFLSSCMWVVEHMPPVGDLDWCDECRTPRKAGEDFTLVLVEAFSQSGPTNPNDLDTLCDACLLQARA